MEYLIVLKFIFFSQKTERKLSVNSYSRLVIVIRSFLSYLFKEKIISKPLALELKTPRRIDKEKECLTDNDIQKIYSVARRLNISRYKVSRILNRTKAKGIVKIQIQEPIKMKEERFFTPAFQRFFLPIFKLRIRN